MISYLHWSYGAFLGRVFLTGDGLASVPDCGQEPSLACHLNRATAQVLRITQWLKHTSLFQEAWLHVVTGNLNWWWSVEVCTFTVGVWAVYLRVQGKDFTVSSRRVSHSLLGYRLQVPHVWAYMLLGQVCAISVAQALFALAVAVRSSDASLSTASPTKRSRSSTSSTSPSRSTRRTKTGIPALISEPTFRTALFILTVLLAGLYSVHVVPSSLATILAMHLGPLLLSLPLVHDFYVPEREKDTDPHWLHASTLYGLAAFGSLVIRVQAHASVGNSYTKLWRTLLSHPAQASISTDAICITISVMTQLFAARRSSADLVLVALTPVLGPSTTLAVSLWLHEKAHVGTQVRRRSSKVTPRTSTSQSTVHRHSGTQSLSTQAPTRRKSASSLKQQDRDDEINAAQAFSAEKTPSRRSSVKKDKASRSRRPSSAKGSLKKKAQEAVHASETESNDDVPPSTPRRRKPARSKEVEPLVQQSTPKPKRKSSKRSLHEPSDPTSEVDSSASTRRSNRRRGA